jgi:sec-independent protein translocase protein TatC
MEEDKELTLREHLEELRVRLVWSALGVAITSIIAFMFLTREAIEFLKAQAPESAEFQFIEMTEGWGIFLKVGFYCSIGLALPFLVYQAVMFIRPALTRRETVYVYSLLPGVAVLFIAGVVFTYYVFLPNALQFLVASDYLGDLAGKPQLRIGDYISDVTKILFGMGLAFETPLIIFFLTKLGVVTPRGLLRQWRYAVVIAFIVAAVITPTWDPYNCTIVAAPLISLYFLGILLSWIAGGGKKKEEGSVVLEEG